MPQPIWATDARMSTKIPAASMSISSLRKSRLDPVPEDTVYQLVCGSVRERRTENGGGGRLGPDAGVEVIRYVN